MKTYDEILSLMKERQIEYLPLYAENAPLGILAHLTPAGKLVDHNAKALGKKRVWAGEIEMRLDPTLGYKVPFRKKF